MSTEPISTQLSQYLSSDNPHLTSEEIRLIKVISECVVLHDALRSAHAIVEKAIDENQAHSEPRHALVLGDAGCGKTTLRDMYEHQFPKTDIPFHLGAHRDQPLLCVSVPASITPRSLAIHILDSLGDHTSKSGTCYELTERLKKYIRGNRVRVIWLDEFQHLFALGKSRRRGASSRKLQEACNWIKSIINDTHVSFVLMGTMETMQLLDHDDQLERRFTHLCALEALPIPSATTTALVEFVDELLRSVIDQLPQCFDLAEWLHERPVDAMRLWVATEGVPSRIKDLVIRAALNAFRAQSRVISMAHFTAAFEQTRRKRLDFEVDQVRRAKQMKLVEALQLQSMNPFAANDDVVKQLARKMAA